MVSSLKGNEENSGPGIFGVPASSIDIMQDRITRSRMVGEPPDLVITPRLENLGLLEFHRAAEAIEAGKDSTRCVENQLREVLKLEFP